MENKKNCPRYVHIRVNACQRFLIPLQDWEHTPFFHAFFRAYIQSPPVNWAEFLSAHDCDPFVQNNMKKHIRRTFKQTYCVKQIFVYLIYLFKKKYLLTPSSIQPKDCFIVQDFNLLRVTCRTHQEKHDILDFQKVDRVA